MAQLESQEPLSLPHSCYFSNLFSSDRAPGVSFLL